VFTLAGDSAGANLNIGVTMKCIELGIRPPDGLFLAYVPVLMSFVPSPSRLLCLMDPLLPFGFVMRCMKGMCFVCACTNNVYPM
jgi:hormone-sensitive lipase